MRSLAFDQSGTYLSVAGSDVRYVLCFSFKRAIWHVNDQFWKKNETLETKLTLILWKNDRTWKLELFLWKFLLMKITYGKIKYFQVCHSTSLFIIILFILSGFTCASSGRSWFHSTTTPPWLQESGLDTTQHLWLQEAWIDLSNSLEYNETWGASKKKLRKM